MEFTAKLVYAYTINNFVEIFREEESRKAVKTLQRQLVEVRKQKEQEIQVICCIELFVETNLVGIEDTQLIFSLICFHSKEMK